MATTRWNIAVSTETDRAVRMLLASRGGRKGDLSRFIEDAVRARLFDETAQMIKSDNIDIPGEEIDRAVEEAIEWARLEQ
jgi:hypothetical protein